MTDDREDGLCAITRPVVGSDGRFPKCTFAFAHKGPHSWANDPDILSIGSVCESPRADIYKGDRRG